MTKLAQLQRHLFVVVAASALSAAAYATTAIPVPLAVNAVATITYA